MLKFGQINQLGMAATTTGFVNDAKVMSRGRATIPMNVREALGIDVGDRVTFIVDGPDESLSV